MDVVLINQHLLNLKDAATGRDIGDLKLSWDNLVEYVGDAEGTTEDKALLASALFDKDDGIFTVVDRSLGTQGKAGYKVRSDILRFCVKLVEELGHERGQRYAGLLFEKCLHYFKVEENSTARQAALEVLCVLLEWPPKQQHVAEAGVKPAELQSSLKRAYQVDKRVSDTLKGQILDCLGKLLTSYQGVTAVEALFADGWLHDECYRVLERAGATPGGVPEALTAGALAALAAVLSSGTVRGSISASQQAAAWRHVRHAVSIEVVARASRYGAIRAALRLLVSCAPAFGPRMVEDGQMMLVALASLRARHPNKGLRDDAEDASTAFLTQVNAELLKPPDSPSAAAEQEKRLRALLGTVQHTASDPRATKRETRIAVRAMDCLAPAAAKHLGETGLKGLLASLAPLVTSATEPLLGRIEDLEDGRVEGETALLGALAALLAHMPTMHEATAAMAQQVAQRIIGAYLEMWPKQRPAVHGVLLRLLLAMAAKPGGLAPAVQRLATLLISYTLKRHPPVITGPLAALGDEDPDIYWQCYTHLWRALLLGEELPADVQQQLQGSHDAAAAHDRVKSAMYDALIRAIMDCISNLDLGYHLASNQPTSGAAVPFGAGMAAARKPRGQGTGDDEVASAELASGLVANNQEDMEVFLRLSGFTCSVLSSCGPRPFRRWALPMVFHLNRFGTARPLLSGFYRMTATAVQLCEEGGLLRLPAGGQSDVTQAEAASAVIADDEAVDMAVDTDDGGNGCVAAARVLVMALREFLGEVLVACRRYKDELLVACLELLLAAPPMLVAIRQLAAVLQLALAQGLQHPPLAEVAVAAIERWQAADPAGLAAVLPSVLPAVEPYFREIPAAAEENGGEQAAAGAAAAGAEEQEDGGGADVRSAAGKEASKEYLAAERARAGAAKRAAEARKQSLESLQPRLQLALGRIGAAVHALVPDNGAAARDGAPPPPTWDPEPRVGIPVPFPSMTAPAQLWLDALLPRAADLAESSPDRRTRLAACELLHAVTLWMVGTNAHRPLSKENEDFAPEPTPLHNVLRRLLPVLLRLAAGSEPVARQLMGPLVTALVHWYTRAARREAAETMAVLEALMDALADENSGALREVAAAATAEFLKWSCKHMPSGHGSQNESNINAKSLLRRLFERLTQSQPYQRLGAANALTSCARVMALEEQLLSDFFLDALHHCMVALRLAERDAVGLGTAKAVTAAINSLMHHCFHRCAGQLRAEDTRSRQGFSSLASFLVWLWDACIVPESLARSRAMLLHERCAAEQMAGLDMMQPGSGLGASAVWLRWHHGQDEAQVHRALGRYAAVHQQMPAVRHGGLLAAGEMRSWLKALAAAADWTAWALSQRMMTPQELRALPLPSGSVHVLDALTAFAALLPAARSLSADDLANDGGALLAAASQECREVALVGMELLVAAVPASGVLDWGSDQVVSFVAAALMAPNCLGLGPSEVDDRAMLSRLACELVQQAAAQQLPLVSALRDALRSLLHRLLPEGQLVPAAGGVAAVAGGPPLLDYATAASFIRGLTALVGLKLPRHLDLLPQELSEKLQGSCLSLAMTIPSGEAAAPQHQAAASDALQLATRLGLPPDRLLGELLGRANGRDLYEAFRGHVHRYILFDPQACVPRLLRAMVSGDASTQRVAEAMLRGVTESLSRARSAGRPDISEAGFLKAATQDLPLLGPLVGEAGVTDAPVPAGTETEKRSAFLDLLGDLLNLDARAVLQPDAQSTRFLVRAYCGTLRLPGQQQEPQRVRALRLLPGFLRLPAEQLSSIRVALDDVAGGFPPSTANILRFSTEASLIGGRLTPMMDALVVAAGQKLSEGCLMLLDVLLPTLQEMATPAGHMFQQPLEQRLARMAVACWQPPQPPLPAAGPGTPQKTAPGGSLPEPMQVDEQETGHPASVELARQLLAFCWRTALQDARMSIAAPLRKSLVQHVAVPLLAAAPAGFLADYFAEQIARIVAVVETGGPALAGAGEELALAGRWCGYVLLETMYRGLSKAVLDERVLASVPGKNAGMLKRAIGDARELTTSHEALQDACRSVRCAAYDTACALLAATQTQAKFFAAAFQGRNKADPADLWRGLLDTTKDIQFTIEGRGDSRNRLKSARTAATAVVQAARAARAARVAMGMTATLGATMGTLGSFDPSLASLTAKVSASQFDISQPAAGSQSTTSQAVGLDMSQIVMPDDGWGDGGADAGAGAEGAGPDFLESVDDELDEHDCMLPLVQLIEKAGELPSDVPGGMPSWMTSLHAAIESPLVPHIARLFLVKAVVHVEKRRAAAAQRAGSEEGATAPPSPSPFAAHAEQFFSAMVAAVLERQPTEREVSEGAFHYMLRDMSLVFLNWPKLFEREAGGLRYGSEIKEAAEKLLRHLVLVGGSENSDVMKTNVEYLRAYMAQWGRMVAIKGDELLAHLAPRPAAAAGAQPQQPSSRRLMFGLSVFTMALRYGQSAQLLRGPHAARLWARVKAVLGAPRLGMRMAEAAGLLLGFMLAGTAQLEALPTGQTGLTASQLELDLKDLLRSMYAQRLYDSLLWLLERCSATHPAVVDLAKAWVLEAAMRVEGRLRSVALEILRRRAGRLEGLFVDVTRPDFLKASLHNARHPQVQAKMLQLLGELLPLQPATRVQPLLLTDSAPAFLQHPATACRKELLVLLRSAWQQWPEMHAQLRPPLAALLADASSELREEVLSFWSTTLQTNLGGRMQELLALAALEGMPPRWQGALEGRWALAAAALLLELPKTAPGYDRQLFSSSLAECEFVEYPVDTWQASTQSLMAPLFSQSYQMSQDVGDSIAATLASGRPTQVSPRKQRGQRAGVRATASLGMTQAATVPLSMAAEGISGTLSSGATQVDGSSTLSRPTAYLRPRVGGTTSGGQRSMAIAAVMRRRRDEQLQATRRRQRLALTRTYRLGELPDVESVRVSSLLAPLGVLVRSDPEAAALALAALSDALLAECAAGRVDNKVLAGIRSSVASCFKRRPQHPGYARCLHALAVKDRGSFSPAADVLATAQSAGTPQAAVLQLEEQLLFGDSADGAAPAQRPEKRARTAPGPATIHAITPSVKADQDSWRALATLYSQLQEGDLADTVRAVHLTKAPGFRAAMAMAAEGRHKAAAEKLDALLDANDTEGASEAAQELLGGPPGSLSPEEVDMCYEQKLRCAETLGQWDEVLDRVCTDWLDLDAAGQQDLKAAMQKLLAAATGEGDQRYAEHLRPFIRSCLFQPALHQALQDMMAAAGSNMAAMDALRRAAGVELAALEAAGAAWERCRAAVGGALGAFRSTWGLLHPLAHTLRHELLCRLQPLAELDETVQLAEARAPSLEAVRGLAGSWTGRWAGGSGGFVSADAVLTVAGVRGLALRALQKRVAGQGTHLELQRLTADMWLSASDVLRAGAFLDTAEVALSQYRSALAGAGAGVADTPAYLEAALQLHAAQMDTEAGSADRQLTTTLFNIVKKVREQVGTQGTGPLEQAEGCALLVLGRQGAGLKPEQRANYLSMGLARLLAVAEVDNVAAGSSGTQTAGENASRDAAAHAKACLEVAGLCERLLQADTDGGTAAWPPRLSTLPMSTQQKVSSSGGLEALAVRHLLKAAAVGGSSAATARVQLPLALALLADSQAARAEFEQGSARIPLYGFLPWISQMISRLDSEERDALMGILRQLATTYPQRVYWPLTLSRRHFQTPEGKQRAEELQQLLGSGTAELAAMTEAFDHLTYPVQRWVGHEQAITRAYEAGDSREAARIMAEETWPDIFVRPLEVAAAAGGGRSDTLHVKFAKKMEPLFKKTFGPLGRDLASLSLDSFKAKLKTLKLDELQADLAKESGRREVALFSPWFATFSNATGPGSAARQPLLVPSMVSAQEAAAGPPQDVAIVGFAKAVEVFGSKQKPKKIAVFGDDFRTHTFVVKGGEDIRMDERVEQLFDVMNGLMASNAQCASRRISLRTYAAIALTPRVGLLEFVSGTRPLESVMMPGLISKEAYVAAMAVYGEAIERAGGYAKHWQRVPRAEAVSKLQAAQAHIRWDALREALLRAAGGPEHFLANRANFQRSLVATSIFGYIAGSGDRHAQNFLVEEATGALVPIDFGYSFGTGTQVLTYPELMPFRLTRVIAGVLQPHDVAQLLVAPMAAALSALTASRQLLGGILTIFIREPLLEWQREARVLAGMENPKGSKRGDVDVEDTETSHISLKLDTSLRKLAGGHPSAITVDEMRQRHSKMPYWTQLQAIVRGDPAHNFRATVPAGDDGKAALSHEDQARCLLDQAMDPNILARTYAGWRPFL